MKRKVLVPVFLLALCMAIFPQVQADDVDTETVMPAITIRQGHEYHLSMADLFDIEEDLAEFEAEANWISMRIEGDTLFLNASEGLSHSDTLVILARGEGFEERAVIPVEVGLVEAKIYALPTDTDTLLPLSGIFVVLIGVSAILLTSRLARILERKSITGQSYYHF